jgi:hypothetical protein
MHTRKLSNTIRLIVILIVGLFILFSCATIPKPTKVESALQEIKVASIKEVIDLIDSGKLKPKKTEITQGIPDPPFYYSFNAYNLSLLKNKFSNIKIGNINTGFLRKEDPIMTFPLKDDSLETCNMITPFNVWQFVGSKGQTIDLMVRSFAIFPVGIFSPYFILINDTGDILARQAHILVLPKEWNNGMSQMIWIKDFIIPETGKYYLLVLADDWLSNSGIRLNNDRIHLQDAYKKEGWDMIDNKDMIGTKYIQVRDDSFHNVYILQIKRDDNITQGKYEMILWSSVD